MADASASWAVELQDKASGPARAAADGLQELKAKLEQDVQALRAMQGALRNLSGATQVNQGAMKELRERIAAQKATVAASQAQVLKLGGAFDKVPRPTKDARSKVEGFGQALQGANGPVGKAAGLVAQLAGLVGKAGLVGAIALGVVALAGLVVGIGAAVAALARYALASADARRSELLRLEGLTKMRSWWGLAKGNANDMQAAIDKVSDSTSIARPQLAQYTEQLYKMGLRGKNLSLALEATAMKASVQGEEMASAFMGMAAGASMLGMSVAKMAERVKADLGGLARRQALSFGVQMSKLRENIARIFSGVKIEGFLEGLHKILELFSQTTASGKAMKAMAEAILNPLFGQMDAGAPVLKRFVQGMVIGALTITIAFLKVRNAVRSWLESSQIGSKIDAAKTALYAGAIAATAFGIALLIVVGAATALGAVLVFPIATAAAGFAVVVAAITAVVLAISTLVSALRTAWAQFSAMTWDQVGKAIIDGIVAGLRSGDGLILSVIRSLADRMKAAFKSVLGIASPSKVFAAFGRYTALGVRVGVEAEEPQVRASVARMARRLPPEFDQVARPREPSVTSRPAPGGRAGVTLSVHELHVHTDAKDPRGQAKAILDELVQLLEGSALARGALPAGGV